MSHSSSSVVAAIVMGIAIIIAALLLPSPPQFVSGGERSAYVANPNNGDLYYCIQSECELLNYRE